MQFIVIGYDGKDDGALDRRMTAREEHLKMAASMYESGKWLYAAAILNDEGKMAGSMIVCDFESKEALEEQWLNNEAYIKGKVWERIEITRAQVAPFCEKI
jgi:uncharacterized protein YciI